MAREERRRSRGRARRDERPRAAAAAAPFLRWDRMRRRTRR